MKKIYLSVLYIVIIVLPVVSQELTIDQVLDKYYKANGFDKMQKINTIIMSGFITRQDYMPMKILKMRPDKYKMEFDIQDITAYQSYDGQTGWMTAPWTGNSKPQIMQEEAIKDVKIKADFDGAIYKWKEKEHKAELIGKENLNDKEVYKVKLTRKDGGVEYYFIDTMDYLLQKKLTTRMSRGKEIEVESFYTDYRDVEGIKFAFANENLMGGQPYSSIQYETIEVNKTVDEKTFKMPE